MKYRIVAKYNVKYDPISTITPNPFVVFEPISTDIWFEAIR
jgi:hypothetical protein